MAIGKNALKVVCNMLGIDPDASLPELVKVANEHLNLNLAMEEREMLPELVGGDVIALAEAAQRALGTPGAKVYRLTATPEGKPPISAVIIVG